MVTLVVAALGGTAGVASARPSGRADQRPTARIRVANDRHPDCHFTTVRVDRPAGRHRGHPTPPSPVAATNVAEVTVEIPPVVLIHRRGRDLDVFTNTGSRPQFGDEFYAVDGHGNAPAGSVLVHEVMERCSAPTRHSDPR